MGNKNKKKTSNAPAPKKGTAAVVKTEKRIGSTELFLIIFAAVALVAIVASVIIGVVMNSNKNYRVDFMNDNLSKYVSISKGDYTGISVEVSGIDPVQDFDVENAILQALCKNKDKEPLFGGVYMRNQTLTAGDVVLLHYRGYTLGKDGRPDYFDGGCNFSSDSSELELGSGGFVPLFELNLIGKNAKDYSSFKKVESVGAIGENDKIFISYVRELNDGAVSGTKCAAIDLSLGREEIDKQYGTLFYGSIVGQQYGSIPDFNVETDNGGEVFKDVKVYRATGEGDVIQLTYSAYYFDGGVVSSKSEIIDLSDPTIDEIYGEGFREFFTSGKAPIGTKALNESGKSATLNTKAAEDEINAFYDLTVSYVYDLGDNPLTIEAYFPLDYQEPTLAGKTAYFDVYIEKALIYDTPEYNDAFITDTLKLTAEDLKDYEGDTLTEKYTAKLKADLEEKYQENVDAAVDEKLWEIFNKKATVKKLPETDVRDYYDRYYSEIETQFQSYQSYYQSIDAFAREYLGISSNADWQAELTKMSENSVKQKLVFYYIIRENGYIISDEELEKRYEKMTAEYFESYLKNVGCSRDKYESDAEYEKAKADYKKTYDSYYTKEYFSETIIYDYGFEKIREHVTATVK